MKKIALLLLVAVTACAMAGCKYLADIVVHDGIMESMPTKIGLGTEYVLDRSAPYEFVYMDGGMDVIIHFLRRAEE